MKPIFAVLSMSVVVAAGCDDRTPPATFPHVPSSYNGVTAEKKKELKENFLRVQLGATTLEDAELMFGKQHYWVDRIAKWKYPGAIEVTIVFDSKNDYAPYTASAKHYVGLD